MVWSKIDNTVTEPGDYLFKPSFIRIALNEIISGTGINVICMLIAPVSCEDTSYTGVPIFCALAVLVIKFRRFN